MGYDLSPEILQSLIAAVTAIILLLIKISMDKWMGGIKTTLNTINTNISTIQNVNIHISDAISATTKIEGHIEPEPANEDGR